MAMMNTFIDPEKIDILCGNYKSYVANEEKNCCETVKDAQRKTESQQSGWTKISSKVKELWRKINPVASGLTTFFAVTATVVKAVTIFCTQCKKLKAVFV